MRFNDDGEPSNSAGRPILGQIESVGLDNVLVCVVRYYGGTKLGVGGLIQAYRDTARNVLEASHKVTYTPVTVFRLDFEYDTLDAVMRLLSQLDLKILRQEFELACSLEVEVPPKRLKQARDGLLGISGVRLEENQSYSTGLP
jgi:putative IMPACT (imprinted ancient) family translation regulator